MATPTTNNRSVARRVTTLAIALVALVLIVVGLAISVLTERSTRAQVVGSVGDTARSVAQSLDAADATNRELVQQTVKSFQRQFDSANAAARGEAEDPLGKSKDMRHEFNGGSLFAIDISISQKMFPLAVLSLGGLQVNEDNGAVTDGAGHDIPGLYAAGRTAIGVASSRYVSGLSLADCVFSGRRAGKAAALALEGDEPEKRVQVQPAVALDSVSA